MQTTAFDFSAGNYDLEFTLTPIGQLQRKVVHDYIIKILPSNPGLNVLEINCGTGVDALWLSSLGHRVCACDASAEMIAQAKLKGSSNHSGKLEFRQVRFSDIESVYQQKKFDFILSNFGGLNCINETELKDCLKKLQKLLNPGGKIILVLMSPKCMWERFYFFVKGKFSLMGRRASSEVVQVHLGAGNYQSTYFYSTKTIEQLLPNLLELIARRPVGFFVPPSYLQPFFTNKMGLLNLLGKLDVLLKNRAWLSNYADHYLIHLENKIN